MCDDPSSQHLPAPGNPLKCSHLLINACILWFLYAVSVMLINVTRGRISGSWDNAKMIHIGRITGNVLLIATLAAIALLVGSLVSSAQVSRLAIPLYMLYGSKNRNTGFPRLLPKVVSGCSMTWYGFRRPSPQCFIGFSRVTTRCGIPRQPTVPNCLD